MTDSLLFEVLGVPPADPDAAIMDGETQCKSCDRIVSTESLEEYEAELGSCGKTACTAKCIGLLDRELRESQNKLHQANDLAYRMQSAVKEMRGVATRMTPDTTKEEGMLAAARIKDIAYKVLHPVTKEPTWARN